MIKIKGFTLIEVLLALAIISIALTALLKATSQNVNFTYRIKEKTVSHWVATQGVRAIQIGLIPIHPGQEITKSTIMLNKKWYWRASLQPSPIKNTQMIHVAVSPNPTGPFENELIAFRYSL